MVPCRVTPELTGCCNGKPLRKVTGVVVSGTFTPVLTEHINSELQRTFSMTSQYTSHHPGFAHKDPFFLIKQHSAFEGRRGEKNKKKKHTTLLIFNIISMLHPFAEGLTSSPPKKDLKGLSRVIE